jgi:hypothetical protein
MLQTTVRMIATFLLLAGVASLTGALPSLPIEAQPDQSSLLQPAPQAVRPPMSSNAQLVMPDIPQTMPAAVAPESATTTAPDVAGWDAMDEGLDAGAWDDSSDADAEFSDNDTLAGFELGD